MGANLEQQHTELHMESTNDSTADIYQAANLSSTGIGRKRKQRQQTTQQVSSLNSIEESSTISTCIGSSSPADIAISTGKQQTTDQNVANASINSSEISIATSSSNEAPHQPLVEMTTVMTNASNCIKKFIELKNEVKPKI